MGPREPTVKASTTRFEMRQRAVRLGQRAPATDEWSRGTLSRLWSRFRHMDTAVRSVPHVVRDSDPMILVQLAVVMAATWVCVEYELHVSASVLTFLGFPLIFPIAFSINEAYNRRQAVLREVRQPPPPPCPPPPPPNPLQLAELQGNLWGLHRFFSWIDHKSAQPSSQYAEDYVTESIVLFATIRTYCTQEKVEGRNVQLESVYAQFRKLAGLVLAAAGDCDAQSETGAVIVAERNLKPAMVSFEKIRALRDYTTPRTARHWFKVLLALFPILLCPVYAGTAEDPWVAYYQAATVTLVFSSLSTMQNVLDNCGPAPPPSPPRASAQPPAPGFNTLGRAGGHRTALRTHPDCIDLSKLEFWPALAMSGSVPGDGRRSAQCTLFGGPTETMVSQLEAMGARIAESVDTPPESPLRALFGIAVPHRAESAGPAEPAPPPPQRTGRFAVQTL